MTEEALRGRGAAGRPPLAGALAGWDAARLAVAAIFLLDGVTWGLWVAHLPLLKAGLRLSDLTFSYALAGIVVGAFVAQPLAGALATRVGTRRVTRPASAVACLALGVPAFATSLPLLVGATALLGLTRGATEVPMNGQATLVEARDGVPRMSAFHGCFSLGGFLGSGLAALLLRLGLGARATLPAAGLAAALVSLLASRALLRDAPAPGVHTTAEREARPSLAATVFGYALVGLGYANLVPILFSASGRRAGSAGIAAVSTLGYFGFVAGPPMIGGLSQLFGSLPLALSAVALFALVIALGAGAVGREPASIDPSPAD